MVMCTYYEVGYNLYVYVECTVVILVSLDDEEEQKIISK